jgi:23S rRNA pseudouridine2605 synthase
MAEERLQKLIAAAGVASRRKAEEMILSGRVQVNGTVVKELGTKASEADEILVDGIPLKREEKVYLLMNKPKHVLCTLQDDRGRKTVIDYLPDVKQRVFPVGRLDYETTGVLILTNDGEFANEMMHPRYHLPKTYQAAVNGIFTEEMAGQLRRGIMLEDGMTLPAKVSIDSVSSNGKKTTLSITIFEGRNREIRRMMEYFHFEVLRLERIRYGFLDCSGLRQGECRRLKQFEVRKLEELSQSGGPDQPISTPAAES